MKPKEPYFNGSIYYSELHPSACFPYYIPTNISVKFLMEKYYKYIPYNACQTTEKYYNWWELNDKLGLDFEQFKTPLQLIENTPKEEVEYNIENKI
jgi:hypothetical protein